MHRSNCLLQICGEAPRELSLPLHSYPNSRSRMPTPPGQTNSAQALESSDTLLPLLGTSCFVRIIRRSPDASQLHPLDSSRLQGSMFGQLHRNDRFRKDIWRTMMRNVD